MLACVRPINFSSFNIHSVDNLFLALSFCSVFSHLLHFFWHFMGIENSRNSYLDFPFFLLGFFKGAFALLQKEVRVISARILADLDQKVPQMLFEGWDILIK